MKAFSFGLRSAIVLRQFSVRFSEVIVPAATYGATSLIVVIDDHLDPSTSSGSHRASRGGRDRRCRCPATALASEGRRRRSSRRRATAWWPWTGLRVRERDRAG